MAKAGKKTDPTPAENSRYWLLERVATGGMAELFKARVVGPEGFDKLVAVKRILPAFSSNEEFVKMFIDEARLTAHLNHPNIVQVFELGRDIDGNLFISMELVPGPEMATLLEKLQARRKRMPEAAALEIMVQVLRGLHHAHQKTDIAGQPLHLVHRDVSPQNVLVTPEGTAKLLDFGVAKAKGRLTETQAGLVKGKLIYMSPEQSRNKPIDDRTDQFAAALVLWECLAGEPCYTFPTEMALMRAVAYGEVRTFEEVGVAIDAELEAVIMRALSPKPDDRWEDCQEFANALLRFKQRNYPSYTPSMLGKLVADLCPKEVAKMAATPDLQSKNAVPLKVAELEISNIGAGDSGPRSKWPLVVGGVLAGVGLLGGGVGYYGYTNAPEPQSTVTVLNNGGTRTVTFTKIEHVVEVHEVPAPVDAGTPDTDAGDAAAAADADGGAEATPPAEAPAADAAADTDAGTGEADAG
jgi:serine/threonine protein kinase